LVYASPKLYGADIEKINERKQDGFLGSIVGDDKAADSMKIPRLS
jgi:hypothetical protein